MDIWHSDGTHTEINYSPFRPEWNWCLRLSIPTRPRQEFAIFSLIHMAVLLWRTLLLMASGKRHIFESFLWAIKANKLTMPYHSVMWFSHTKDRGEGDWPCAKTDHNVYCVNTKMDCSLAQRSKWLAHCYLELKGIRSLTLNWDLTYSNGYIMHVILLP